MKVFTLVLFIILLPISLVTMLMPSAASFLTTAFFGIGNLIAEAAGIGSFISERFTVYTQLIAASILVSLPIMLWGVFCFVEEKKESKFIDALTNFFFITWWLFIILEIGSLIGIYFWAASSSGLGGIETTSGTEGYLGWLGDFGTNFSNIYGWYVYPFFFIAIIIISIWLCTKSDSDVGKIVSFSLLGIISLVLVPSLYAVLLLLISAFIIIVVFAAIILGSIALIGGLDDGKIHGHIDSNGDITIDKY